MDTPTAEAARVPDAVALPAPAGHVPYADHVRVFATVAVIAVHTAGLRVSNLPDVHTTAWQVANAIDASCRWAVPLFLMLSGALILPARDRGVASFYRKRLVRVGIPLAIWATVYFWWAWWRQGQPTDAARILASLRGGLVDNHLYFLVIIIGLYLVTPALRLALRRSPTWVAWASVVAAFALCSSGWFYRVVPINAATLFLPYLPYFVLGSLLREPVRIMRLVPLTAAAVASAWIAVGTAGLANVHGPADPSTFAMYSHFHPLVIAQSIAVFVLIRSFGAPRHALAAAAERNLAGATFGVYLMHMICLDLVRGWTFPIDAAWTPALIPAEIAVVFIASSLVSLVLLRIPYLRIAIGS
jgi:surface polysaccharide O-acyltransferase-like enzyme